MDYSQQTDKSRSWKVAIFDDTIPQLLVVDSYPPLAGRKSTKNTNFLVANDKQKPVKKQKKFGASRRNDA
uniref:Uncharacterized protein n=1 Tax=Romanomermis culicivorax TaxID=13658 RepID=A0A915K2P6_ROMCU